MGARRVCEDRLRNASSFVCDKQQCTQRDPRWPDDGEWECVEMDGVMLCHSLSAAAGVAAGKPDLGWVCGARRGARAGERVCIDLAPDRPEGKEDWYCVFQYVSEPAVKCTAGKGADSKVVAGIGAVCLQESACPQGAQCIGGRCLPPRPEPACWLDADCGNQARCLWGTCLEKGGS
jgi:hypothetical protein